MGVFAWIETQFLHQTGHVFAWMVISFACGIGAYFGLRFEPSVWVAIFGLLGSAVLGVLILRIRYRIGLIWLLLPVACCGASFASISAHLHNAPRLAFHYYGPIVGRVVKIDRSSSYALRLTLDQVILSDVAPSKVPNRVRVSLHGQQNWIEPSPGQRVGVTGHLSAPNGPVEPGGFDFQRHAWFLRLGAVGYSRSPALVLAPSEGGFRVALLRQRIARHVQTILPGDIGGFAAAVTTGDRSGFSEDGLTALRVSNLAHLLAISGLHMGLLATFLFVSLRSALCLWQTWALGWPVKKIAALAALSGATGYLLLSGASIATQRAYIMAAVALVAISLDRRALTLRAVTIAALIVLVLRPVSLLSPGFHMSFAATTALVAVFSALREAPDIGLRRWQKSVAALVMSSLVAGLATAPFAAAHFNQWAAYGLLANVSAVPVMGLIVVPGAVLAAVLSPLGLEWLGLELMGLGLRWILFVAHSVSGLEGARIPILTPQSGVLALLSLSGCWLVLWQGQLRWLGILGLGLSVALWQQTTRPNILISGDGKLMGVLSAEGRVLSKGRGQGFVARSWLENDGDDVDQPTAAARGLRLKRSQEKSVFQMAMKPERNAPLIVQFQGKRGAAAFAGCETNWGVVSDQKLPAGLDCQVFDKNGLSQSGAVAIWFTERDFKIETVQSKRGNRLWSPRRQLKNNLQDQ